MRPGLHLLRSGHLIHVFGIARYVTGMKKYYNHSGIEMAIFGYNNVIRAVAKDTFMNHYSDNCTYLNIPYRVTGKTCMFAGEEVKFITTATYDRFSEVELVTYEKDNELHYVTEKEWNDHFSI